VHGEPRPDQPGAVRRYLPLAHILELIVEVMTISQGGQVIKAPGRL
jgi:hypothetical protein